METYLGPECTTERTSTATRHKLTAIDPERPWAYNESE